MSETRIIPITSGDSLHTYGSIGTMDYTVRLSVRLDSLIDGEALKTALEKTQKRYPYLKLRMKKQGADLYYEENPLPVCLFNTDRRISLNCEETNYHIWAVCYKDNFVYLDFYHGICDGTGMYMVLSTLLYYYIDGKYGNCDSTGIRTLEEIAAVKGNIFLSFHQRFKEDKYYKAVLKQLEDHGIPYIEKRVMENDISHFPDAL